MSAALHLDMKSMLYVTAGRLSQEGGREHLKGLLQSLASKMLEKEAGGLPMLLRAAKEAGGHHLVIFLCRSLYHRPQQEKLAQGTYNYHGKRNHMRGRYQPPSRKV